MVDSKVKNPVGAPRKPVDEVKIPTTVRLKKAHKDHLKEASRGVFDKENANGYLAMLIQADIDSSK